MTVRHFYLSARVICTAYAGKTSQEGGAETSLEGQWKVDETKRGWAASKISVNHFESAFHV